MAKNSADLKKVTFGVRRKGKAKKSSGPKEKAVSKYRGQGKK
jgi:hypothetical protein